MGSCLCCNAVGVWCPRISPRRCLTYARCIFGYVPISFVCAAPHHCCDPLCNGPASGLKLESIFAACLPHLCRTLTASLPHLCVPTLPHLCRIFAASLLHVLGAYFASGVFCNITCPIFYSISRSWPHLAAGHSWFYRAPQSSKFPKVPEFKNIDL